MKTDTCAKTIYLEQLKAKHKECLEKASYLKKLVDGSELVSFPNIERAREALLQLNQAKEALARMRQEEDSRMINGEDLSAIDNMERDVGKYADEALKNWNIILQWIPPRENRKDHSIMGNKDC